jgi:hypothetical protein
MLRQKEQIIKFFVTNLRKDRMILGHPWLCKFNPQINWTAGTMKGMLEVTTTATKQQIAQQHVLQARRLIADPQKQYCMTITNFLELGNHA